MNSHSDTFPNRMQLWQGAVLATIAHAISVAADPILSYELSWDGINYNRQDSQGTRGTVTFAPLGLVAVFRDDSSTRAPWRAKAEYDLDLFFKGIPDDLRLLAENEALQYSLDEFNGKTAPIITAAFWGRGDDLGAAEPWAQVFDNGAHLMRTELAEPEVAIADWAQYYGLSSEQTALLRALYTRRIDKINGAIVLGEREYATLTSAGSEGIDDCRELLTAVGIALPE